MCKGPEAGPCQAGWSGMGYGMREEGRVGRAQGGRAGLRGRGREGLGFYPEGRWEP